MVMPSHFTSLIQASAMYCGPQSHRRRRPRVISLPKAPKACRTPWRIGSSAAQRSPILAVCQPTISSTAFLQVGGSAAREYSEATAQAIDGEIARILDAAHRRVRETLTARRSALEALAKLLIDKEVIDADQLRALVGGAQPP